MGQRGGSHGQTGSIAPLPAGRVAGRTPGRAAPFGAQLKRYRRAAGLTQAALAERIGRGRIYIAQLEGAAREPSLVTLGRLARALQVPVGVLLELPGSGE